MFDSCCVNECRPKISSQIPSQSLCQQPVGFIYRGSFDLLVIRAKSGAPELQDVWLRKCSSFPPSNTYIYCTLFHHTLDA